MGTVFCTFAVVLGTVRKHIHINQAASHRLCSGDKIFFCGSDDFIFCNPVCTHSWRKISSRQLIPVSRTREHVLVDDTRGQYPFSPAFDLNLNQSNLIDSGSGTAAKSKS